MGIVPRNHPESATTVYSLIMRKEEIRASLTIHSPGVCMSIAAFLQQFVPCHCGHPNKETSMPCPPVRTPRSKALGLTLVELMVTVAVAAIVLAIGVPQLQSLLAGNQVLTVSNGLATSLNFARSEAIKRGMRVTLCPSSDGQQCATNTTPGWEQGWIVFLDHWFASSDTSAKVNTGRTTGPNDTVIAVQTALPRNITVRASTSDGAKYISFGADGRSLKFSLNANTEASETTLRVCSASSTLGNDRRARDIGISRIGRLAVVNIPSLAASCPAP